MMIKTIALLFLLVGGTSNSLSDSVSEVIEADKKLNMLIMQNKVKEANPYYMDDFILITAAGRMVTKQEVLDEIASPELKLEINETADVKVRVHDHTAVLTAVLHQKGSYKGNVFDARLLVTDTWIKTGKGWQLLSGHAGRVKE